MNSTPAPKEPLSTRQQEKLSDLTNQSWNLELVISGAALFAVLQLPDVLERLFDYIQYNLIADNAGAGRMLPLLAYNTMRGSCYVLFIAFLANFIMRAFWVGLVGLLAVYPSGIRYDRIPFVSKSNQKRMEEELGPLDGYILALDRRCNIVFATAFLFVLLLIIIGFGYLAVLLIHSVLRPMMPVHYWETLKVIINVLMGAYLVISLILSLPQLKEKPALNHIQHRLGSLNKIFLLGFYRPVSFITNTFYSHISYKKMIRFVMLMTAAFFVLLAFLIGSDLSRMDGHKLVIGKRHLFTERSDGDFAEPAMYDNQRGESASVPVASIQSDVIREPFIRLFIAYPKTLDILLAGLAKPQWPDQLPKEEKRRLFASWSLKKLNETVQLKINDSLYTRPDLLFSQRGPQNQVGWQTVLIPNNLRTGKNQLSITLRNAATKKDEKLLSIPFWYIPER